LEDGKRFVEIVDFSKDVIPLTGLSIFRFYAVRKRNPNRRALLDQAGKVIDYEVFSKH
jgi:hypothetical protein